MEVKALQEVLQRLEGWAGLRLAGIFKYILFCPIIFQLSLCLCVCLESQSFNHAHEELEELHFSEPCSIALSCGTGRHLCCLALSFLLAYLEVSLTCWML